MLDIYDVILIGGIFCSFITSILLFIQGRYQLHANRLLSIVIFTMGWYGFIHLFIQTGWLKYVPGIYRIGSPLYYLAGPCAYLYVRSIIRDEDRFRKWDWLHFLPAILHVIELLPFYFSDAETKRQVVESIGQNFHNSYRKGSGLIPAYWHFVFRPFHIMTYLVLQWVLLISALNRRNSYSISSHAFTKIKKWLLGFTGLWTILISALIVQSITGALVIHPSVSALSAGWIMHVLMALSYFLLSVYLFFKPEILYGTLKTDIPRPFVKPDQLVSETPAPEQVPVAASVPDEEPPAAHKETLLDKELVTLHAQKIEEHLAFHQSFRKQGLTIGQLAAELAMPSYHLSYVLNYYYKQRFTDFINQYRVDYVRVLFREEEWRRMKLETLAAEAGFSSRSTFFGVFKKITGLTPSEYAKQAGSL